MKVGTKSVLFGAHCFFLHPWFVALAWWKLYGFPWDPRLWAAFFVHDLGYWGKPNMDGEEGERHPMLGASIMSRLFDSKYPRKDWTHVCVRPPLSDREVWIGEWGQLCLFHSRYLSKKWCHPFSRLCVADKLAIALTPAWIYLPMVELTGEHWEYIDKVRAFVATGEAVRSGQQIRSDTPEHWYADVQQYCLKWVEEHRDGRRDRWTSSDRQSVEAGVDGTTH